MILTNIAIGIDQLLIRLWVASPDGLYQLGCYRLGVKEAHI